MWEGLVGHAGRCAPTFVVAYHRVHTQHHEMAGGHRVDRDIGATAADPVSRAYGVLHLHSQAGVSVHHHRKLAAV